MSDTYLTIKSEHCTTEFTKEQFLLLLKQNNLNCASCQYWTPPSEFMKDQGYGEGVCSMIPAAGGAFHSAGTYFDDFCTYFDHKTV